MGPRKIKYEILSPKAYNPEILNGKKEYFQPIKFLLDTNLGKPGIRFRTFT